MTNRTRQWVYGALTGVAFATMTVIAYGKMTRSATEEITQLIPKEIITAYNQGIKDALKTNPASWELEETCLSMWATKQVVSSQ